MTTNERSYNELIKEEKDNPQFHFNKTFKCPHCGKGCYERWVKIGSGVLK